MSIILEPNNKIENGLRVSQSINTKNEILAKDKKKD